MAIDPKHLPDDPKTLQQMVLDLMAQLDREFSERSKVESLLRELLDAKRNRKSEQLSEDQLALFASLWQARQAEREAADTKEQTDTDDDELGKPGAGASSQQKRGGRQALARRTQSWRWHLARSEKKSSSTGTSIRPTSVAPLAP